MGSDSASTTVRAFSAKSAEDKVTSYMWYVHVLVKVNTEERLRANIAPLLERKAMPRPFAPTPTSPLGLRPLDGKTVNEFATTPEHETPQATIKTESLADHLILWLFERTILEHLVGSPPVLEQANGYSRVLCDIPACFREEFCRRLYHMLFDKRIVEWPQGIEVPEPEPALGPATPDMIGGGALHDRETWREAKECFDAGASFGQGVAREAAQWSLSPGPATAAAWWTCSQSSSTSVLGDCFKMERGGPTDSICSPVPTHCPDSWMRDDSAFGWTEVKSADGEAIVDSEASADHLIPTASTPKGQYISSRNSHVSISLSVISPHHHWPRKFQ